LTYKSWLMTTDADSLSKGDMIAAIKSRNILYVWTDLSDRSLQEIKTLYNDLQPNPVMNHKKGLASRVVKKK
jgi:hypothetical protein